MSKGLPKDPTDLSRYTRYQGAAGLERYANEDCKRLSQEQITMVLDIFPQIVGDDSHLLVETLPGDLRKLTFSNTNVKIICDPRDHLTQQKAQEQLIAISALPLGLTRSPFRNLVARISLRLRHFGYM